MNDDFVPSEFLKRCVNGWWFLVLTMVLGGIGGMAVTRLHKPVYESTASITASIDFAYAGRIDEEQEDFLLETVGDFITSTTVMDEVIQNAADEGIILTYDDIAEKFSKTRQGYRWELSVRDSSPTTAQLLNQFWVEAAKKELARFREQSLESFQAQTLQLGIEKCLSQRISVDPASASCTIEDFSALQQSEDDELENYSLTSSILMSKVSTEITDEPFLPTAPILYKQNLNTLAGSLLGLLIGLAGLLFWKTKTK